MKTNYRLALWLILLHALISHGPVAQAQSTGPGSALNLDGASGYAQVANGVWFNGNFTIEGWVYVRSYNNWSRFIDFTNGPNTNWVGRAIHCTASNGKMARFRVGWRRAAECPPYLCSSRCGSCLFSFNSQRADALLFPAKPFDLTTSNR